MGFVYLLHFSDKIGNLENSKGCAQHYLGYTSRSLKKRLSEHKNGMGAKITRAVVQEYKYELQLVRHWSGCTRETEREFKRRHSPISFCPLCNPQKDITKMQAATIKKSK
ncbi:MAG: GIY-YIG nuclease family protein [Brasilonema octagenarum HA4186-MV1]|nr:GIY-YIG nuclease family protein [Brasilonema octagenarum HA4186-MV1]